MVFCWVQWKAETRWLSLSLEMHYPPTRVPLKSVIPGKLDISYQKKKTWEVFKFGDPSHWATPFLCSLCQSFVIVTAKGAHSLLFPVTVLTQTLTFQHCRVQTEAQLTQKIPYYNSVTTVGVYWFFFSDIMSVSVSQLLDLRF